MGCRRFESGPGACISSAESINNRGAEQLKFMDRRHWLLFLAAIACIAGLVLWISEIDLGMEESIAPAPVPSTPTPAKP
jgi:hypothetical protein